MGKYKLFFMSVLMALAVIAFLTIFAYNEYKKPASEVINLSEWQAEYKLTFNNKSYIVTGQSTEDIDQKIGSVVYHGNKPGFFDLYSIKQVNDYSKIAVETNIGYLVALAEPDEQAKSIGIIEAVKEDPRTSEYPTKLEDFSFDYDQDNKEEKIELYTAAGRYKDGNILWDDGQNWLLVVVDGDKYYKLFSGFVQLSNIYFTFSTIGEDRTPNITFIYNTQCGLQVIECLYNKEKDCFETEIVYQAPTKNVYYSSIPGYK